MKLKFLVIVYISLLCGCATLMHNTLGGTIKVKVIGVCSSTKIRYAVVKNAEEKQFVKEFPYKSAVAEILSKGTDEIDVILPWDKEIYLKYDEILFLQINPIDFKENIKVEIWEDDSLKKKYKIRSNIVPFQIRYSLD